MTPIEKERAEASARHEERAGRRKQAYEQQLSGVRAKLDAFSAGELGLSPRQLHKLEWNLAVLQFRAKYGHRTRWADDLPDVLQRHNPQHVQSDFVAVIGNISHDGYTSWKGFSGFRAEILKNTP